MALAAACSMQCISSYWGVSSRFNSLSLHHTNNKLNAFKPLSSSANISLNLFSRGSVVTVQRPARPSLIVCEAAPKKKADSAVKRARQAEKRRVYNKSKKSEFRTRMKKVFKALDVLRKKSDAQAEEVIPIEKLIAEAYSAIDKAVKAGAIHRNTGARRKSRLARRKKTIEIHHGWYTPAAVPDLVSATSV